MESTTAPSARRPPLWRELALALGLLALYLIIDALGGQGRTHAAERHARWINQAEAWLHIDIEHWLNGELVPHHALTVAANYEYATTYIISALLMLVLTEVPQFRVGHHRLAPRAPGSDRMAQRIH